MVRNLHESFFLITIVISQIFSKFHKLSLQILTWVELILSEERVTHEVHIQIDKNFSGESNLCTFF